MIKLSLNYTLHNEEQLSEFVMNDELYTTQWRTSGFVMNDYRVWCKQQKVFEVHC